MRQNITQHIVLIFMLLAMASCSHSPQPKAVAGVLNTGNTDIDGVVKLNGEWNFYWNRFVRPDSIASGTAVPDTTIYVPSLWNGLIVGGKPLKGQGFATYSLKLVGRYAGTEKLLKFTDAGTSCRLFIDGTAVFVTGQPATNASEAKGGYKPGVVHFRPLSDTVNIVLHISNFNHKKGGPWTELYVGGTEAIERQHSRRNAFDWFLLGCMLVMCSYHLFLFISRQSDYTSLAFSILLFLIGLRIITTGERIIYTFIDINWHLLVSIEYISFYLAAPAFVFFNYTLYKDIIRRRLVQVVAGAGAIFVLSVVVLPVKVFSYFMLPFEGFALVVSVYFTWLYVQLIRQKRQDAKILFLGWLILFVTLINDILYNNELLYTYQIAPFGVFLFVLLESYVISSRVNKAFAANVKLAKRLEYIKTNQEKILRKRTDELVKRSEEIQRKNEELEAHQEEMKHQHNKVREAYVQISGVNLELKQQRAIVQQTTERFKALFEKNPNPYLIINEKIADCNQATVLLLQVESKDDVINRSMYRFAPAMQTNNMLSPQYYEQQIQKCKTEGTVTFEWIAQNNKLDEIILEVTFNAVVIDHQDYVLALWHNITQRKEAEATLKKAHQEIMVANREIIGTNIELEMQTEVLMQQKEEIELKNRDITASINYARRIQQAILPPHNYIKRLFPQSFLIYYPRDIVSGDFFWLKQRGNKIYMAVGDCTGHGVPGAIMSMLGISLLNEIFNNKKIEAAGEILNELRKKVIDSLRQTGRMGEASDGMDIALCIIDTDAMRMQYAGAHNPVYVVRKNEQEHPFVLNCDVHLAQPEIERMYRRTENANTTLLHVRADKMPIGIFVSDKRFVNHYINLRSNDMIYAFSDGFIDQFGGDNDGEHKFTSKRLKRLLLHANNTSVDGQEIIVRKAFADWRGKTPQVDDVILFGFKMEHQTEKKPLSLQVLANKNILIVEDDELNSIIMHDILSSSAANVLHTANGKETLRVVRERRDIHLILLDIGLPDINGYEVLEEIRRIDPGVIVIFQTAFCDEADREKGFKSGCNDYITKPINRKNLLQICAKYLAD